MWRLSSLLVLAILAACATTAAQAVPATPPPQLGVLYGDRSTWLVRIDPDTLHVLAGTRLAVGGHTFGWSYSSDGARLALGGDLHYLAIPSVLVVDTRTLRALGQVRLARSGWVRATTWLPDGRVVAVVSVFTQAGVHTDVVTLNSSGRAVQSRRSLAGQVLRVARTPDGLVALLASAESLTPARLAIVGPAGSADVVVVDGILAGSGRRSNRGGGAEFSNREPGLAVDPDGGRAFVVSTGGDVAEVDLGTQAISYHRLSRHSAAVAKSIEGPTRVARWLGGGLIAVSGGDYSVGGKGAHPQPRFTPSGLELIDTRTWTARRLGSGTDTFWPAGDLLLAAAATWSSELQLPRAPGLVVYGPDRRERLRLFEGKRVWVVHADARRTYVHVDGRVDVVDLGTGHMLERRESAPEPLVRPGAPTES